MTYDRSRLIIPPWGGWNDSMPSPWLPHNSFKTITGWLFNKGRIQSYPNYVAFSNPPNGEAWAGAATFEDQLGNPHTGVLTKDKAYYLNQAGYVEQGTITPASNQPFSVEVFLNRMFFVNGAPRSTLAWLDGSQGILNNSDIPGTGFFLSKLNGSLFVLNLFESNQRFPISGRFSAINNHLEWNLAVDPTAGSFIIPEVEDEIAGVAVIRDNMAIYRTRGISILSSTGGSPRFSITNFNTGVSGVGVFYEYTLANYGDVSIFASEDDIYLFSLSTPDKIGGNAKTSIFKDLNNTSGRPWACQTGQIGGGIDYRAYWLSIPLNNNTISSVWVFHFDDKSWVNEQLPYGALNWMGNVAVS
jgi:hypothetical protein